MTSPPTHPTDAGTPSRALDDEPNEPAIILGPREQLFHLLAEAAEIEHTLMCSYLYAAFSLKPADDASLSADERDAVARWRKAILSVAIDEMSHLLLVSNLTIALGGRPHFGRPNFPVETGYFPSGVVVKLTPFNADTLDHFIFLERPRGVEEEDGEGFDHPRDYVREEAYLGLMPSVQDYSTVGRLYEALRANLIATSARLGPAGLFIGSRTGQVAPEAVSIAGVHVIEDLDSALLAIDTIIEQGEGFAGDREDSHYERFRAIQRERESLMQKNPAFAPAWAVAENPVMRRPPDPREKVFIDEPKAARVLDLANAVYNLLMRCLVQAFGRQGTDALKQQARYLNAAIELMHVLASCGGVLACMPASRAHPGVNAGLTFTILRSVEPLLQGTAERLLLQERLLEIRSACLKFARIVPPLAGIETQLDRVAEHLWGELPNDGK